MPTIKMLGLSCLFTLATLLAACGSPDAARNGMVVDAPAPPPLVADTDAAAPATRPVNEVAKPQATNDISRSCKVDADCAIKDVGSCCGYSPQCVNRDSPTFPEQVKAQCASEGRMSVCGFPSLSGCQCVQGQCAGVNGPDDGSGRVQ